MKPNELTPEQAIERVEGGFHHACDWRPETEPGCGACPACLDNEALRLVIEAAKRPTALSGEERYCLNIMLDNQRKRKDGWAAAGDSGMVANCDLYIEALTAALSLASPFTREDIEKLKVCVNNSVTYPRTEELILLAKLDAMLAQSAIEE